MDDKDYREQREDVYAKSVRAGKRTYFFDVKQTKNEELYITITESKRRFNESQGKFFYEKHKIFLYKEDFEKFADGMHDVIDFVEKNQNPNVSSYNEEQKEQPKDESMDKFLGNDIKFEDFGDKS